MEDDSSYSSDSSDEESQYQLKKANRQTNQVFVGNLVRVSIQLDTTNTQPQNYTEHFQMWGKVSKKHSDELFDVESEGKGKTNDFVSLFYEFYLTMPQYVLMFPSIACI